MTRRGRELAVQVAAWASLVGATAALAWLTAYAETPGEAEPAPARWPAASQLPHDASRPTLVLFTHPMCACTRASLAELRTIASQADGGLAVTVALFTPSTDVDAWDDRGAAATVRAIPGVRLVLDVEGREASRFGARTSGHAVLYAPAGTLLFSGGITPVRGHVGDNAGRARILAVVRGSGSGAARTPTFGCPLDAPRPVR